MAFDVAKKTRGGIAVIRNFEKASDNG